MAASTDQDFQAIAVGRWGTTASFANVLSACGRFGLGEDAATAIIAKVVDVVSGWRDHFAASGVAAADLQKVERHIGRLEMPA